MAVGSLDHKRFNLASTAISPFSVPAAISSDWLSLARLRFCSIIIITNIVIFIPVVIVFIGAQFLWFSIIINIFLLLFIIIDIDCFLTEKKSFCQNLYNEFCTKATFARICITLCKINNGKTTVQRLTIRSINLYHSMIILHSTILELRETDILKVLTSRLLRCSISWSKYGTSASLSWFSGRIYATSSHRFPRDHPLHPPPLPVQTHNSPCAIWFSSSFVEALNHKR